jgi:general stress protein YciG
MTDKKDDRPNKRGFGSMDPEKQRKIASVGGKVSGGNFKNNPERAADVGRKGGLVSSGNFKHDPTRAAEAGRKGGIASHRKAGEAKSEGDAD